MSRLKRERVASGIYRDASGYSVLARVGTGPKELSSPEIRFPLDTALSVMEARWFEEKSKLKAQLEESGGKVQRGTLRSDGAVYLKTATLTPRRRDEREQQLGWWCERFGNRLRKDLKAIELQQALKNLKKSESTINKYRTALSNVYTVLDGKSAPSPFRDIPRAKEQEGAPRDVPYEFIQVLLAKVSGRGEASLARLRVLAYVPVTKPQLLKMDRGDVIWEPKADGSSEMYTPGRDKGAGTKGKRKPLMPQGLEALREFDRLDLWQQEFSNSSLLKAFKRARKLAVAECRKTHPELDLTRAARMLRKDLRHSFGTMVFQQTGDIAITAELMDHKDHKTTLRYTKGALPEHLKKAGVAIAAAFAAIPPYVPPPADPSTKTKRKGVELPRSN